MKISGSAQTPNTPFHTFFGRHPFKHQAGIFDLQPVLAPSARTELPGTHIPQSCNEVAVTLLETVCQNTFSQATFQIFAHIVLLFPSLDLWASVGC